MNLERLELLAVWLEGGAKHERLVFDMEKGLVVDEAKFEDGDVAECGTACCIAGAAVQFFCTPEQLQMWLTDADGDLHASTWDNKAEGLVEIGWDHVFTIGMNVLGLTPRQASALFVPTNNRMQLHDFNDPIWAGRVVRRLIETGEVNWEAVKP